MKEELGVSLATVKRLVADLQKNGKIQRQGSIWMIKRVIHTLEIVWT